jgi:NADH-quinone oxidoreductase subunit N
MIRFDYKLLLIRLLPEIVLVLGALWVLFFDQFSLRASVSKRSRCAAIGSIITLLIACVAVRNAGSAEYYGGMLVISSFSKIARVFLLVLVIAIAGIARPEDFTQHIGEFFALLLLASVGLIILAATQELLTGFIALELTSLALYLLTAFSKGSIFSVEAGLKYFLFGSVASAFMLFGISLVLGLSGATGFREIGIATRGQALSPLMIIAMVLLAAGFAFKLAAAPLHLWAPDAYQGSPAPAGALAASASKLASFVFFLNFFVIALPGHSGNAGFAASRPGWTMVIAILAAASMIAGNLIAIAQSNFRRLIAYSAVAHAGYVLLAVLPQTERGAASAVYYLFTYGAAVVGIFGVIRSVESSQGELKISDLAGLGRRSPALAICLCVFILSLAGIPPLAGFFGKFYIFVAALEVRGLGGDQSLLWLVILALAASTISLYYYLQVLKQAFVVQAPETTRLPIRVPAFQVLILMLLAALVVVLGCAPNLIVGPLQEAASAAFLH